MLITFSCPIVNFNVLLIFEGKEHIIAISVEVEHWTPSFHGDAAEDPTSLVFNDKNCSVPFSTPFEESYETATVFIHLEDAFPFAHTHEGWQLANNV